MLQTRFSACVKKGKYRYIIQIYFYLLPLSACKAAIIKIIHVFVLVQKKLFSCCSKVEKLVILTTQKILQLDEFDDDVMPIYENTFNSDPGTFVFFLIVLGFCVVIWIFYIYLKWHEIENHKGLRFEFKFQFPSTYHFQKIQKLWILSCLQ